MYTFNVKQNSIKVLTNSKIENFDTRFTATL